MRPEGLAFGPRGLRARRPPGRALWPLPHRAASQLATSAVHLARGSPRCLTWVKRPPEQAGRQRFSAPCPASSSTCTTTSRRATRKAANCPTSTRPAAPPRTTRATWRPRACAPDTSPCVAFRRGRRRRRRAAVSRHLRRGRARSGARAQARSHRLSSRGTSSAYGPINRRDPGRLVQGSSSPDPPEPEGRAQRDARRPRLATRCEVSEISTNFISTDTTAPENKIVRRLQC